MRCYQVFARMTPEQSQSLFGRLKKETPGLFQQSLHAASAALKSRPAFLVKQPFPKQADAVRRAFARVASNTVAEETLAVYFLEVRKELLVEWLDAAEVEHDEGALKEDSPAQPDEAKLRDTVATFRAKDDDPDRDLLLMAFAAQESVEWPVLESLFSD